MTAIRVCVKGAGEMASAVAWRLFTAGMKNILMLEIAEPLAVRRKVSFCEAVYDGSHTVQGVEAVRVEDLDAVRRAWAKGKIAVAVDPGWSFQRPLRPDVLVDAILAKRNLGSSIFDAPLVIALGPGFRARRDAHFVIETNRGPDLGRIISQGCAEPNTGIPGNICGHTADRVLRAPAEGVFQPDRQIGEKVVRNQTLGRIGDTRVIAPIDGVLRGLIRPGICVHKMMKIGDIDPRGDSALCDCLSDKAAIIAQSVLDVLASENGHTIWDTCDTRSMGQLHA
ncbi:MAG: selenium-dependent molybdenum cofactor biosynthesis protein YqeB [Syntrophobacteraceae bacterium]